MGHTVHSVRHEDHGALQSRRLPQFVIFNPDGDLVVSAGVDETLLSQIKQVVDRTAPTLTAGGQTFTELDEASPIHIFSLEGKFERFIAVFLVRFGYRGSVDSAARFFKLTKRETEVLKLIIRSHSTGQIADLLCISPGTASEKPTARVVPSSSAASTTSNTTVSRPTRALSTPLNNSA